MASARPELARIIDHTLLKPEATAADIDRLCQECVQYGFAAACVNPTWVSRAAMHLAGTHVAVATVAGFPLGAGTSEVKAYEAWSAVAQGATEVDMVVNLGALIAGDTDFVTRDIALVAESVKRADPHALVKVILETRALTAAQLIAACRCCVAAKADFVKTSTGFHPTGGATVEHVRLLKQHAAPLKVKASGGIRDLPTALAMVDAGADRLGLSASVAVVTA